MIPLSFTGRKAITSILETDLALLWGAYRYLRDHEIAQSSTSRLLRSYDPAYLKSRLRQELLELAGVIRGDHRHRGPREDVLLEATQVGYWSYLLALGGDGDLSSEELQPHAQLEAGAAQPEDSSALVAALEKAAQQVEGTSGNALLPLLKEVLRIVGQCCARLGVSPEEVVRADLNQMRERAYLAPYFDNSGKG